MDSSWQLQEDVLQLDNLSGSLMGSRRRRSCCANGRSGLTREALVRSCVVQAVNARPPRGLSKKRWWAVQKEKEARKALQQMRAGQKGQKERREGRQVEGSACRESIAKQMTQS